MPAGGTDAPACAASDAALASDAGVDATFWVFCCGIAEDAVALTVEADRVEAKAVKANARTSSKDGSSPRFMVQR